MMRMLKTLGAVIFAMALPCLAFAQSSPNLTYGQVPTPAQWSSYFLTKQDALGFTPMNQAGGVFLGRVVTAPPGSTTAGLNLTPGTTPASPVNGDLWSTASGLFTQINGVTHDLVNNPCTNCAALNTANTFTAANTFSAGTTVTTFFTATGLVTLSDLANLGANTAIGSIAGGTPAALSTTQLTTLINPFTTTLNGAVTAPTSVSGRFLGDDGAWHAASGSGTVTGPTGASTANAIPRWSNTGGIILLNSGILIDGSNNITGAASMSNYGTGTNNFNWGSSAGTLNGALANDSNGTPNVIFFGKQGTGLTFSNGTFASSVLTADGLGGFLFKSVAASSTNVAATQLAAIDVSGIGRFANVATGQAAHSIPINEGTLAQNTAGPGTLGQYLASNGASADQTFKSGGWTLLNTLTASSSSTLSDTTSLTSSYNEYEIVFENLILGSSGICEIIVQTGGSFVSTGYVRNITGITGGSVGGDATTTTNIPCGGTTANPLAAGAGVSGMMLVSGVSGGGFKNFVGETSYLSGTNNFTALVSGYWGGGAGAITGVQVQPSAGTLTSGTIKVYGRL